MVDLKRAALVAAAVLVMGSLGDAVDAAEVAPPAWLVPAMQARIAGNFGVGMVAAYIDGAQSGVVAVSADATSSYDGDTVFEIGSVTKLFTTTLLAELINEGVVTPDEPIDALLPPGIHSPRYDGRPITLVDLATQTSGLSRLPANLVPRDINNPYADYTNAQLFGAVNDFMLARRPGSAYEYSNFGIAVLGQLLATKLKTPYETAIQARMFGPLGMTRSSFDQQTFAASTAPPHDADGFSVAAWTDLGVFAGRCAAELC